MTNTETSKRQQITYTFTVEGETFTETTARAITHAVVFDSPNGRSFWTTRDVPGTMRDLHRRGFRHVATVEVQA